MPKYVDIANAIYARVKHGDYRLRGFPSHADLTAELGVNSRTVSKALSSLIDQGVLARDPSGRIEVRDDRTSRVLHIAVLSPAFPSENILNWHRLIQKASSARDWAARPVFYSHWHDAAITEAFRGMDGLFVISRGDDFPQHIITRMQQSDVPVVVLEQDMSSYGIPSMRYCNPGLIEQIVTHLCERGHRRIACLNAQPHSNAILDRIQAWRLWTSAHGVQGPLIDEPVTLGEMASKHANSLMTELLESGRLDATAAICTTFDAAIGAMRSVRDHGLKLGADVAITSVEEWVGLAPLLSPSVTCLQPPPMIPLLEVCLDYFQQREKRWMAPLLMQPTAMQLFVGESSSVALTAGVDRPAGREHPGAPAGE